VSDINVTLTPVIVQVAENTYTIDVSSVGVQGPTGQTGSQGPTGDVGVAIQGSAPSILQLWADTSTVSAQVAVFDGGTPSTQLTSVRMRRGTASAWTTANPILDNGEFGFESDTTKFKIGDGSKRWSALSYVTAVPDLRDATVTGTQFTMTGVTVVNGTITGGTA